MPERSGWIYDLFANALEVWSVEGYRYGWPMLADKLSSREDGEIIIMGTPGSGKTNLRLAMKSLLEEGSFGLHSLYPEIPERRIMMYGFDNFMIRLARERYGPLKGWSAEKYESADLKMAEDIERFKASEEVRHLRAQGYLPDFIYEIPYVHAENGVLLGKASVEVAANRVKEEIATKGYSNTLFLMVIPDPRTIEAALLFRQIAVRRKKKEVYGLKEEMYENGFRIIGNYPSSKVDRLIYDNARSSAPPRVVEELRTRELRRAVLFYHNMEYSPVELEENEKKAIKIYSKCVFGERHGLPSALRERLSNDHFELMRTGELAAYYYHQMLGLGVPSDNFAVVFNGYRQANIEGKQKILVRLDPISLITPPLR